MDAHRGVDKLQFGGDEAHHFGDGKSAQGKEMAADAEAEEKIAHHQAKKRRQHSAGNHPQPGADGVIDQEDGGGVPTNAVEDGMAEGKLAGITGHQVPGVAQMGPEEHEDGEADEEPRQEEGGDE